MNPHRRVVVTGLGVVSSIGSGMDGFREALFAGKTGFSPVTPPNPDIGFTKVAAVSDFDPGTRFESRLHQGIDRNAQFALAAAEEAIRDSGLVFVREGLGDRTGVITGSGIGGP